jgi:hypothetical protein
MAGRSIHCLPAEFVVFKIPEWVEAKREAKLLGFEPLRRAECCRLATAKPRNCLAGREAGAMGAANSSMHCKGLDSGEQAHIYLRYKDLDSSKQIFTNFDKNVSQETFF